MEDVCEWEISKCEVCYGNKKSVDVSTCVLSLLYVSRLGYKWRSLQYGLTENEHNLGCVLRAEVADWEGGRWRSPKE